jgi:hypothetical protein
MTTVVAVDWSGAASATGQRARLWLAVVRNGRLSTLRAGLTRSEAVALLRGMAEEDPSLVVGLDFAFSFPAWFVRRLGVGSVAGLWQRVDQEGERWLADCRPPFWGRPGKRRPVVPAELRRTEAACRPVAGIRPKSAFQIGGAGAVGTGSLRGQPYLLALREAGFSVWPFDPPVSPAVVEIYPRALTGPVRKSDQTARRARLLAEAMPPGLRRLAEGSEDAFDAALSALAMHRHLDDLLGRPAATDPTERLEGAVWVPDDVHGQSLPMTVTQARKVKATSTQTPIPT